MAIVKGPVREQFTQIPNTTHRDTSISFQARGFLGYLISFPEGWIVRPSFIAKENGMSKNTVYKLIKELVAARYMMPFTSRLKVGKFGSVDYAVFRSVEDYEWFENSPEEQEEVQRKLDERSEKEHKEKKDEALKKKQQKKNETRINTGLEPCTKNRDTVDYEPCPSKPHTVNRELINKEIKKTTTTATEKILNSESTSEKEPERKTIDFQSYYAEVVDHMEDQLFPDSQIDPDVQGELLMDGAAIDGAGCLPLDVPEPSAIYVKKHALRLFNKYKTNPCPATAADYIIKDWLTLQAQ